MIFEFEDKALKIYNDTTEEYLQNISQFQKNLIKNNFSFAIPHIIEIGSVDGTFYTTEKKLNGLQMDLLIPSLNNVLVANDLSISAVLDLSSHAVVGDPCLDVSSVLTWNTMDNNVHLEDYNFLYEIAEKDYGKDIHKYIDIYLLYSSFYYSDMGDPSFSINNLNNDSIWKRISA